MKISYNCSIFKMLLKIFEGVDERKEHETVKDTRR